MFSRVPSGSANSHSDLSLRRLQYSFTHPRDLGVKNTCRSLFPLPIIWASPVSNLTSSRLSDRASEIRMPVPSSTSTRARNPSHRTSIRFFSVKRGIAETNCSISTGVRNTTSRRGIRGMLIDLGSITSRLSTSRQNFRKLRSAFTTSLVQHAPTPAATRSDLTKSTHLSVSSSGLIEPTTFSAGRIPYTYPLNRLGTEAPLVEGVTGIKRNQIGNSLTRLPLI